MFCPQCGAENEKDKSYCRRCGQSLAVVARLLDAEDESVRPKLTTSLSHLYSPNKTPSNSSVKIGNNCRGGPPWPPVRRIDRSNDGRPRRAAPTVHLQLPPLR